MVVVAVVSEVAGEDTEPGDVAGAFGVLVVVVVVVVVG